MSLAYEAAGVKRIATTKSVAKPYLPSLQTSRAANALISAAKP